MLRTCRCGVRQVMHRRSCEQGGLLPLPAPQEGRCIGDTALRRAHHFLAAKTAKAPAQVFERALAPAIPGDLVGRGVPEQPVDFDSRAGRHVREIQAIVARPHFIFLFQIQVGNKAFPGGSEPPLALALVCQVGTIAVDTHGNRSPGDPHKGSVALSGSSVSGSASPDKLR